MFLFVRGFDGFLLSASDWLCTFTFGCYVLGLGVGGFGGVCYCFGLASCCLVGCWTLLVCSFGGYSFCLISACCNVALAWIVASVLLFAGALRILGCWFTPLLWFWL